MSSSDPLTINNHGTTHSIGDLRFKPGRPMPFGAKLLSDGGLNFSVYSRNATTCDLVLYKIGDEKPWFVIPFEDEFQIGDVFCMTIYGLDHTEIEYGYRMDGPYEPRKGHRFDVTKTLLDPYARIISGRNRWGEKPDHDGQFQYRGRVYVNRFDWQDDRHLGTPIENLVIYEMHVRGFTAHESSEVEHPGTFDAIREKIPYLKELGVNAVELMPVFEFDELENSRTGPDGEPLKNFWGYSTVGFFAPKAGYSVDAEHGRQADEFKELIRDLHAAGIEVILDVVFNHTAEGNEDGQYISFKGIDNSTYYMLTPSGDYINISGTGNTMNCNNPIVRHLILDSLRYWASEFHVDGFRFDLAMILQRDAEGHLLDSAPLMELLDYDPILSGCKLIAEAWDTHGYQVGSFPSCRRWAEWNGLYRDQMRRFLKSDLGLAAVVRERVIGSPDLYAWKNMGTRASINFITCHDGFTLNDLWSYNEKHNLANGEQDRDGAHQNDSWNCGVEGPSDDPKVLEMRRRQIKNSIAVLMTSRGTPMILAGDEMGRTQRGNNNAYCQDNELSWLDWSLLEPNQDIYRFMKHMIAFRKMHRVLREPEFPTFKDNAGSGLPDVSFHGTRPWEPDFSPLSRTVSILWDGQSGSSGDQTDQSILVLMNMWWGGVYLAIPPMPRPGRWHQFVNTALESPHDIVEPGQGKQLDRNAKKILVGPRSIVILTYCETEQCRLVSHRSRHHL